VAAASSSHVHVWKRALAAADEAVSFMALPNTRVPLQARVWWRGDWALALCVSAPVCAVTG
jgi:hypothetical protein